MKKRETRKNFINTFSYPSQGTFKKDLLIDSYVISIANFWQKIEDFLFQMTIITNFT